MTPLVSVIIPNFNHAPFLKERIESILNQSYPNYELIILDDCSSDSSKTTIENYTNNPKVTEIIYNTQNSGSTFKQWKKGIEAAKGELIWIAESDDYADINFLQTLVPLFEEDPSLGIAFSQSYRYSNTSEILGDWSFHTKDFNNPIWGADFKMDGTRFIQDFMLYKNPIPNASAVVFRKKYLLRSNGLNASFKLNGDWFMYSSILSISNVAFVRQPLNYFREHSNKGSSRNVLLGNNVKEYYMLASHWQSILPLSMYQRNSLKLCAFNIWKLNFDSKLRKMFQTNFLTILCAAIKVDKYILLRFLRFSK